MECSGVHPPYTRLPFLLALCRKSELKQRHRFFRCAACKCVFTGGATKLKVWCCQSEIVILYIVDVISVVEISHPISFSQFAKGISILLYLEVKGEILAFLLLKDSTFILFMFLAPFLFYQLVSSV